MIPHFNLRDLSVNTGNFADKSSRFFNKQTNNITNLFFISVAFLSVLLIYFRCIRNKVTFLNQIDVSVSNTLKKIGKQFFSSSSEKNFTKTLEEREWHKKAIDKFGATAEKLKKTKSSWKDVVHVFDSQIMVKSNTLSDIFPMHVSQLNLREQNLLNYILSHAAKPDKSLLEKTLKDLNENELFLLNRFYIKEDPYFYSKTPLETAASFGHLENVKLLVNYGAKDALKIPKPTSTGVVPTTSFIHEFTALSAAIRNGHVEIVRFLLENGAKVPNYKRDAPSFLENLINSDSLKDENFLECLLLLLNAWKHQNPDLNVCDHPYSKNSLKIAFEKGHVDVINLLLAWGISQTHLFENKEFLPDIVFKAIFDKNLPLIKLLHERNLFDFINYKYGEKNDTVLSICVIFKSNEILEYLIKAGVSTQELNSKNETYMVSGQRIYQRIVFRTLSNFLKASAYKLEDESGIKFDSFEAGLKEVTDINLGDEDKNTLLHFAVNNKNLIIKSNQQKMIRELIKNGAQAKIKNAQNLTPLSIIKKLARQIEDDDEFDFDDSSDMDKDQQIQQLDDLIKFMENPPLKI